MLTLGTIVLGAEDVHRAAAFWSAALGYVPRDADAVNAVDADWTVLVPAEGGKGPGIALGRSATPVQEHPRVHLDLYADDAADQAAQVERLIALGAGRVEWDLYPPDPDFVVLADTEGNRFCVIDTSFAPSSGAS
ncbi:VOC family protein [Streptomyces sp. MI02-7b]|uniref:VOC family protein n=1 Tax=Streptomyces sp. MI02-7b TaxID=462941 RepID=UPI0029AE61FA|nr:VOC family protein [Streptomyces sp. MI02-7b]MDX3077920.1 VOC family protein [Streptomyces sp. MI02-7b]